MAKIGAEYILRWLPRGTHEWKKFITPAELHSFIRHAGATPDHTTGLVLNPLKWEWGTNDRDVDVNYMVVAKK